LSTRQALNQAIARMPSVEHGVVAEQRHVTAGAGRGDDRRQEAAGGAEHGQDQRILQHRQHRRQRRHRQQQSEGRRRGSSPNSRSAPKMVR
jgi:hypothetical protein